MGTALRRWLQPAAQDSGPKDTSFNPHPEAVMTDQSFSLSDWGSSSSIGEPPARVPPRSFPWYEAWIKAVTEPDPDSYRELLDDPKATSGRAFTWVFVVGLIVGIIQIIAGTVVLSSQGVLGEASDMGGMIMLILLCAVPLTGAFAALGLAIGAGITSIVAQMLGGEGTYREILYGRACYWGPATLFGSVVGLLSNVPCIGILASIVALVVSLYTFALDVILVKAANRFGWGKAVVTVLLPSIVACAGIAGCLFVLIALSGPEFNQIFSEILLELEQMTPMP